MDELRCYSPYHTPILIEITLHDISFRVFCADYLEPTYFPLPFKPQATRLCTNTVSDRTQSFGLGQEFFSEDEDEDDEA